MVRGQRVDGLVVVRTRKQDERIEYLRSVAFPFVAFGRIEGELDFPFVDEDDEYGLRLIADHLVNRYPVYNCDIRPLGFQFIELDGYVDDRAVEQAIQIIRFPKDGNEMVENNFVIAHEHFSLEALEVKLKQMLASF